MGMGFVDCPMPGFRRRWPVFIMLKRLSICIIFPFSLYAYFCVTSFGFMCNNIKKERENEDETLEGNQHFKSREL